MINSEKLNNLLEQGETILWSGVPQPYGLLDESRKPATVSALCWALAWAIFSVGGYYALTARTGAPISTGVILFLLCISLIIIWMPISDKFKVKKLSYAVTDKRAIIVSKDNEAPIAMPLSKIDAVRIDKADNGNCHVRVGSPVFKKSAKKLPVLAYRGEYDDQNGSKVYKGLVLFNVKNEDGRVLSDLLKKANAC